MLLRWVRLLKRFPWKSLLAHFFFCLLLNPLLHRDVGEQNNRLLSMASYLLLGS